MKIITNSISKKGVQIQTKKWNFSDFSMSYSFSNYSNFSSFNASNSDDCVRLHLGIKGDYSFEHQQLNRNFDLAGGHHNIMYSRGLDLSITNKTLEIETIGIDYPVDLFAELIGDENTLVSQFCKNILDGKESLFSETWGRITIQIQHVIDEILDCTFEGKMAELYLRAKSTELLILCIDNYCELNKTSLVHVKQVIDKQKVIAARNYLLEHYKSAPKLNEVALAVELSPTKLKSMFLTFFGCTIFQFIESKRMQASYFLLKTTDKSISEIAHEMGFSSPQHFSSRFKQKFMITPKSIRNNS